MITVYALTTCPWCKKVKLYFTEKGVSFTSVDVDAVPEEKQKEALAEVERLTGKRSFPVTVINEKVITGYRPEEFDEVLKNEN